MVGWRCEGGSPFGVHRSAFTVCRSAANCAKQREKKMHFLNAKMTLGMLFLTLRALRRRTVNGER